MSFFQDITGQTASDASKAAAADKWQKQNTAIRDITDYGNTYAGKYADLAKGYDPYVSTGYTAVNQLQQLLSDPNNVRSLPGYQFGQDEGMKGLERSAAARSGVQNGGLSKDLLRYSTGYADQTYGNELQRLLAASGQGAGWLGNQNDTVGKGLTGQLGTRQLAFGGSMDAAGTVGQDDIAAANAKSAASQNLLNLGVGAASMAMGGGGGFSSMFGGGGAVGGLTNGNGLSGAMGYMRSGTNPFNSDGSRNTYYGSSYG